MGFHTACSGFLVKDHGNICDILRICCESITDKNTRITYNEKIMRRIVNELLKENHHPDYDRLTEYGIVSKNYTINLDEDFEYDETSANFIYKPNPKIKIGNPTSCGIMIYVGDPVDDPEKPQQLADHDLLSLIALKQKLVFEGKLSAHCFFTTVINCCG